jgi:hypothetical protein
MSSGRALRLIAAFVGLATLAACSPGIYSVVQERAYSPAEFRYAAQNKDLLTVIRGNPFETEDALFRDAVVAAMQPENWGFDVAFSPRTRLTEQPDDSARTEYFVAVLFDGSDDEALAICRGDDAAPEGATAAGSETSNARMAFCRNGQVLSMALAELDGLTDPFGEPFQRLMARLTRELFPQRDYRGDDGAVGNTGMLF